MENTPKSDLFDIVFVMQSSYEVSLLCHVLGVSVSGYYKHRKLILSDTTKKYRESKEVELIRRIVLKYKRKYGYRMITMKLLQEGIVINHKKVLRLMKKYNLLSKVRKRNPYRQIQKATQEHRVCKNILGRQFGGGEVYKKYGTDISYLFYANGQKAYLSILKDMLSGEIVSYELRKDVGLGLSMNIFNNNNNNNNTDLLQKLQGSIIHSDQGWHYTHPQYQDFLKKHHITQSMSRKGNCLDNAPTESFFGHLKDEIKQEIKEIKNFQELKIYIQEYIFEYNNCRPQWNRKKMTPVQYRNHLLQINIT